MLYSVSIDFTKPKAIYVFILDMLIWLVSQTPVIILILSWGSLLRGSRDQDQVMGMGPY